MNNKLNKKAEKLNNKMMEYFKGFLCGTYRETFDEDKISDKLVEFARDKNLNVWQGSGGEKKKNVIMYKSATGKYTGKEFPPVILQSHMDMVCKCSVQNVDIREVFKNGLELYFADAAQNEMMGRSAHPKYKNFKTTLGGDDGIGVAAACAILESQEIEHPPIIAIFTVEEENGMGGASNLTLEDIAKALGKPLSGTIEYLRGAKFINIDDERDGIFSISCAGSLRGVIKLPIVREEKAPENVKYYGLCILGLTGGHSGLTIHEGRANANILLCDAMQRLTDADINLSLISFEKCDNKHNTIPEFAKALVAVPLNRTKAFEDNVLKIENEFKKQYSSTDPKLKVEAAPLPQSPAKTPYSENTLKLLLPLVCELPNGVLAYVPENKEEALTKAEGKCTVAKTGDIPLVETSSNLGIIEENAGRSTEAVIITCMIRSSVDEKKVEVANKMRVLCNKYGATFEEGANSPGWAIKPKNALCELFLKKYKETCGTEAQAVAIHAGLECGHFAKKFSEAGIEEIDMIACGPELKDVHTIKETLYMDTVPKLAKLLVAVLEGCDEMFDIHH